MNQQLIKCQIDKLPEGIWESGGIIVLRKGDALVWLDQIDGFFLMPIDPVHFKCAYGPWTKIGPEI